LSPDTHLFYRDAAAYTRAEFPAKISYSGIIFLDTALFNLYIAKKQGINLFLPEYLIKTAPSPLKLCRQQ